MKALVWHGAGDLRLESVPEPVAGPGDAVVEVAYCGICGTDLHEYLHGPVMIRPSPHPLTGEAPPLALGHEFSGRVVALGAGVTGFSIGQRVAVDPCWRCGECAWCLRGEYNICRKGGSVGLASAGALAERVRVPAAGLVPLPENVDDMAGALAEPLAVGLHAVRRGGVVPGMAIAIIGFGAVGAAVAAAALAAGVTDVFVSEPEPGRRELAAGLAVTECFDPREVDVRRELYLRTGRIGPDVVFECTGHRELLPVAVDTARRGGRVVMVGIGGEGDAALDPRRLVLWERELVGSLGYRGDVHHAVDLMAAGRIHPQPLITNVVGLDQAVTGAFEALAHNRGEHLKILVAVHGVEAG